jgi:predicted phage tail protein
MDILKKLLTACRGFLIFSGGKYKLVIDKAETAAFTFSEDNIVGAWNISLGNKNNQFNRIRANFFNPDRNWQPDLAIIDSTTLRTSDNGLLLEKTIDLPFTSDIDRAKMITTINLNQSRQQIMCEFTSTIEGLRTEVGDVVYIKHATTGWDTLNSNAGKLFRVMRITLQNNDEVRILAMEYDATAYDFGTISATDAAPNTNLPDALTVIAPTALSASEALYSTIGGAGVKVRVTIDWNASKDIFVREYEVEWRLNGSSTYTHLTTTRNLTARLDDADPNVYDFRVRAINSMGVSSDWATLDNVTIAGLTVPPVDVDGLSLIALGGYAHLSWDLATDLDVRTGGKVRFRHSNLTSGASWESSTDIGSAVAGHSTTAVLPLLTGTYMAKFVDSTSNESVNASSFVSTTVPDIIKMNAVATSTQEPLFTGTKTNMVAVDNVLKFEADTLLDSVTESMDDWELLDAIGGLDTSGTYEFDTYLDLGATYTSRATAEIAFSAFVVGDTMDDRTTLMDTWTDFDNVPSDVNLDLYVATTTDDPSGSPTWGSWAKFTVADYSARALKFKVEATSSDADHQINVTALSVSVDFPDRVQGDNALQSGVGTKSITYPSSFYAIPSVGITGCDLDQNDRMVLSNETKTGFDVTFYQGNGTGSPQDIKFNWLSRGY